MAIDFLNFWNQHIHFCFRPHCLVLVFVTAFFGHLTNGAPVQGQQGGAQDEMCLYEDQLYPPGSIINMGRAHTWCYGSYCGKAKKVKYWDDYNCPMPTRDNPSPQIPSHVQLEIQQLLNPHLDFAQQQQQKQEPAAQQKTIFGTPMFGKELLFPLEQIGNNAQFRAEPTTEPPLKLFNMNVCWYRDRFFWPGADIFNTRNGNTCRGAYCDWNAKVQHWEDTCTATVAPPPRRRIDRT